MRKKGLNKQSFKQYTYIFGKWKGSNNSVGREQNKRILESKKIPLAYATHGSWKAELERASSQS